mgnify:CR=1 FL=1
MKLRNNFLLNKTIYIDNCIRQLKVKQFRLNRVKNLEYSFIDSDDEITLEKLIELGFTDSDWGKIERQLKDDAINFNFMVCKDYTDAHTGMAKVKYVDVTKFICAWTDDSQGDNTPFAGHFEKYSIPQVRDLLIQNG